MLVDLTCGTAIEDTDEKTMTGVPRGGVYFEAGFAAGLGLPVIWTVQGNVADIKNVVHFDVRQYNQIRWSIDELDKARQEIEDRLVATLGEGPSRAHKPAAEPGLFLSKEFKPAKSR